MDESQVRDDMKMFSAPSPDEAKSAGKAEAAKKKAASAATNKLRPEQIKAADKFAKEMKAEDEAAEKAELLQKLDEYMKFMKEYHPDRLEYLKIPKAYGVKNTCEELRIYILSIERECGKKGALDTLKMVWIEGFKVFTKANENERFGLKVDGLDVAAQQSVMPRVLQDGTLVPGPAVPTLAEFACKYSSWFSTSVEMRLVLMAVELVAGVHRMNSQAGNVQKASEKQTSKETKDLMKDL